MQPPFLATPYVGTQPAELYVQGCPSHVLPSSAWQLIEFEIRRHEPQSGIGSNHFPRPPGWQLVFDLGDQEALQFRAGPDAEGERPPGCKSTESFNFRKQGSGEHTKTGVVRDRGAPGWRFTAARNGRGHERNEPPAKGSRATPDPIPLGHSTLHVRITPI